MPPDTPDDHSADSTQPKKPTKAKPLPTVDELLHRIEKVRASALVGVLSTRDAAFQLKCLESLLRFQQKREESGHAGAAPQQGLLDLCRAQPELLNYVEGLLPEGVLQRLVQELGEDGHDAS